MYSIDDSFLFDPTDLDIDVAPEVCNLPILCYYSNISIYFYTQQFYRASNVDSIDY